MCFVLENYNVGFLGVDRDFLIWFLLWILLWFWEVDYVYLLILLMIFKKGFGIKYIDDGEK